MSIEERHSWRIGDWLREAGNPISRPTLYDRIRSGKIDARKDGRNTLILTSPLAYLQSLPKGIGPGFHRGGGRPRKQRKAGAK
jgi:hypothetical protein